MSLGSQNIHSARTREIKTRWRKEERSESAVFFLFFGTHPHIRLKFLCRAAAHFSAACSWWCQLRTKRHTRSTQGPSTVCTMKSEKLQRSLNADTLTNGSLKLSLCIRLMTVHLYGIAMCKFIFFIYLFLSAIGVEMRSAYPNQGPCPHQSKALTTASCHRPATRPAPEMTNSYLRCLVQNRCHRPSSLRISVVSALFYTSVSQRSILQSCDC